VALRPTLSSGLPLSGFSLPLPFGLLGRQEGQRSGLFRKSCASQHTRGVVKSRILIFINRYKHFTEDIEARTIHVAPSALKNLPGKSCPELPRRWRDEVAHTLRPADHRVLGAEEASRAVAGVALGGTACTGLSGVIS
jgi:hypothetical protein